MNLPPVLLLHGWGGSFASTWAALGWREALGGRTLIEVDLPGHGVVGSPDPAAYADLAGSTGALFSGCVDVIAFSLGAKIAMALAAAEPARFRRIVLAGVGDNAFAPEPDAEPLARALTGEPIPEPQSALAALVDYARASGADSHALAAVLRRPANPDIAEAALGRIGDALLVNGTADRIAQPDARLRGALGSAHYLSLAGVDHVSLPANPDFRAAAVAFVSS